MCTMSQSEIRAKLERAFHKKLTRAEWQYLMEIPMVVDEVREYEDGTLGWHDLRGLIEERLDAVRRFYEAQRREESGEIEMETDSLSSLAAITGSHDGGTPDISRSLSDRTVARARAISALNRLRAGARFTTRPFIDGTRKPRGGVDGTLPQWVIFLGVEAWVPAEEVKDAYRIHQQAVLTEQTPPKTQQRALEVARFVWEEERVHGERPPWPVLWERWNNWPLTKPFKTWRNFRTYFLRGEQATRPQYTASNEQIVKQVDSGVHEKAFDFWTASFRV